MSHVHWWLVALAFVCGLVLTLALMIRPVKRQVPVGTSAGEPDAESALATTKIPTAVESPTTKMPVAKESPTTKIPVAKESPTTKIPVAKESPTTKIRVAKESPTTKIPVAKESPTTRIPVAKESPTTKIAGVSYAPFGSGSARARADGSGPAGWLVKGRSDTRLYYIPDDPVYNSTVAQIWFKDEESASRAYFTPWRKSSKK
jgi:uncharacterized membrane protein ArfC